MWRKGNPPTPMMGMYIAAATVKNSMEIPFKTTICSSNPTPGHLSRENHTLNRYMHSSVDCSTVLFFFFNCLFRVTPMTYGSSQARGQIGAVAASLYHSHSNKGSKSYLHHSSRQCRILNPLSEVMNQTRVLMNASRVC